MTYCDKKCHVLATPKQGTVVSDTKREVKVEGWNKLCTKYANLKADQEILWQIQAYLHVRLKGTIAISVSMVKVCLNPHQFNAVRTKNM